MGTDILKDLTVSDVQSIFPKSAAQSVKSNWPIVSAALRNGGFAGDATIICYAIATIYAETGNFVPRSEGASTPARGRDGRDFGAYDQVSLTPGGSPRIGFTPDHKLKLTQSSLGNKPHLAGTYLDPEVSGENAFRSLKGLPPRTLVDNNDGERFKGRGFVQITGRYEYEQASKALGLPNLLENPDLANEPATAAKILVWRLKRRQSQIRQNLEGDTKNYLEARAAVNGKNADGTVNGLEDFTEAYDELLLLLDKKKKANGAASAPTQGSATTPARVP